MNCGKHNRLLGAFLGVVVAFLPFLSGAEAPERAVVDFQRYFPQFLAVSEEVRNKEFPEGVQYRLISTWDEQEGLEYVVLIRRDGHDHVLRILLSKAPLEGAEQRFRQTADELSKKVGSGLEVIDLRGVRSLEEFHARAVSLGWGIEILK